MNLRRGRAAGFLLAFALVFPVVVGAQGFFIRLSGAPASIDCQATQVTLTGGNLTVTWDLPPGDTVVTTTLTINNVIVFSDTSPFTPSSGSQLVTGSSPTFGPVAFPYTAKAVAAPQAPGIAPVSYTVQCGAAGPASGFSIQNASPVLAPVPAVSTTALALLAALLTVAGAWAMRGRSARPLR